MPVYLALPSSLHCDYATRAAQQGIHVLCEKPMAVTVRECRQMITAAQRHRVKTTKAFYRPPVRHPLLHTRSPSL